MDAQQQPQFFDPRGRRVLDVAPPVIGDGTGLDAIIRANAPLAITATTGFPRCDGNTVNYVWVIDDLCAADRLGEVSGETQDSSARLARCCKPDVSAETCSCESDVSAET